MSSGTTFFRESASYVFATWPLTKLKNQRWPIHITPARTWIQRKTRFNHSETFESIHPPRQEQSSRRTLAFSDRSVERRPEKRPGTGFIRTKPSETALERT